MRGHGIADIAGRQRALEEHRGELQGRLPRGPFEFADDLTFDSLAPDDGDPPVVRRLKLALQRDCRHATALPRYIGVFGLSNNLRSIYDGGGQIQDGGGG